MRSFLTPAVSMSCLIALSLFPWETLPAQNNTAAGSVPRSSALAGMRPGEVVVITLEGTATAIESTTGKTRKLAVGDRLLQGWTILTKGKSKVGLGFANGTFLEIAPDSKFVIEEFFIEPWDVASKDMEKMDSEPSKSKTRLFLESGEVLADIKKLNSGSGMEIVTPLATAGIRGTTGTITHRVNSDGTPRSTVVNVPDGSMTVTPNTGGDSLNAAGPDTAIISTAPGADGQGLQIQSSTGRSDAATSSGILQGAQSLRSNGTPAFLQGMRSAAQNPLSFGQNLSPDQRQQLQEASEAGADPLIQSVTNLSSETPALAPEIAQFAALLAMDLAPQIAAAATSAARESAVRISVAVSVVVPSMAGQIASGVAALSAPEFAPQIAGATARVVPSQTPEIAGLVAQAVPAAAPEIGRAVGREQPQQSPLISQRIIDLVPEGDAAGIRDSTERGAAEGTAEAGSTVNRPPAEGPRNSGQPVQPVSRP